MENSMTIPWVGITPERALGGRQEWLSHTFLASLPGRIRTGCVYEVQPSDTLGVLVTRADPRTRHRRQRILTPIYVHWPAFAPSTFLLTGHETACRVRRCRGQRRCAGHAPLQLGWLAFADAYRAELECWPFLTQMAVARQIAEWLHSAPTVTILSFERRIPPSNTHDAWAQRHVFRDWLVSLLPLAVPLAVSS
jgi:hypothetical protein